MANRQLDEERIFHTARKIDSAEARGEYLEQTCAGDQPLGGASKKMSRSRLPKWAVGTEPACPETRKRIGSM